MKRLHLFAKRFFKSEVGATLVEYGLLVGLLSIVVIGSVATLASHVNSAFVKAEADMVSHGMQSE